MPKYHKPVILTCSIEDGEENGRCRAYMAPGMTTKSRDLVKEFLDHAGNAKWRIESLSKQERFDCGVPKGSQVVSFPARQKDWFYQAFDEFMAPYQTDGMPRPKIVQAQAPA